MRRDRGAGRVGVRYLLLIVVGAAVALSLAWYLGEETAATATAVVLGLPAAYLAWAAFRADRAEAGTADMDTAVRELAVAVRAQWQSEAAVRRVQDPYPLPVAWRAADEDLTESWPLLAQTARTWPGGPPGDSLHWPAQAAGLAGSDAEIGEVFSDRVPTRRLVVLGEPGAGKSVLLIRLLLDLLHRRGDDGPVPVLFSLASWDPDQHLAEWLAEQLRRSYPGLRAAVADPVNGADEGGDLARAMLDAGRILPLLDGFDELPPAVQPAALDALNRAVPTRGPLVLTSRTAAWRAALAPSDASVAVRLNGAAVIELLPLDAGQAAEYLRRDAGGEHSAAARRWDAVVAQLGTDSPVGQALSTPLGLFLARTIYNPRPLIRPSPDSTPEAAHPDELCDTARFPDRAAVDTHLFHAFIPAAYRPDRHRPARWSSDRTQRTLVYLARFLRTHRGGSPDLAWWELPHAVPIRFYRLTFGITYGVIFGITTGLTGWIIFGVAFGITFGITFGIPVGLVTALVAGEVPSPGTRLRWSPRRVMLGLVLALVLGLAVGLSAGLMLGITYGIKFGLACGLGTAILVVFLAGLKVEFPDLTVTTPDLLLSSDRRTFTALGLVVGLGAGATAGIALWLPSASTSAIPTSIGLGLGLGLALGTDKAAWLHFMLAMAYLSVRGKVPRDLMGFLRDAHERGLLRQVGPVYQFRHIDLQHHLAQQQPR